MIYSTHAVQNNKTRLLIQSEVSNEFSPQVLTYNESNNF